MALISMPFAMNMLEVPIHYCCIIGVIWAGIIFTIDRSLVSNMKKGGKMTLAKASTFVLRFIFAIGLGFVISDPLVLQLFKPTIQESLTIKEKENRLELNAQFDTLILQESAKIDSFRTQVIHPAEEKREVFLQLYQWEKNGKEKSIIYNGIEYTTSGYSRVGERARMYEESYNKEQVVVDQLYNQLTILQEEVNTHKDSLRQNHTDELNKLNEALSRDYLTRAKYLDKLASEAVSYTHLTLPTICSV